mgnify:CR=1 FL=1
MLAKMSVDQALMKAKSHIKNNEITEAQKLYQTVLLAFPHNKRAQQGLASLNKPNHNNSLKSPSQDAINQLMSLYNQGQLSLVVQQAKDLTEQYPEAFIIWNILGAAHIGLGQVVEASEAFNAGSSGAAHFFGASADCSSSSLRTSASNSSIVFSSSLAIG